MTLYGADVSADRVRPSRIRAEQDRALARYVRTEVYAFSPFFQARLDECGLGRTGVMRQEDLARLPPIDLADVDPAGVVLRPLAERVVRYGPPRLAMEMRWARFTGGTERLARARFDPDFKPVRWMMADGVPIGSAATDIERLADLGRRLLELAGLEASDVLVGLVNGGDDLAFWQLALGARNGGVPSLFVPPDADPDTVANVHPTTLTGRPEALLAFLRDLATAHDRLPELRTVIVTGPPPSPDSRAELTALATDARGAGGRSAPAVVAAWAPHGARAMWSECRGGSGYHTWPTADLVQAVGSEAARDLADGELVWSSIGWRGSVVLRLRTGEAGRLDRTACPTCGRTTPRVLVAELG